MSRITIPGGHLGSKGSIERTNSSATQRMVVRVGYALLWIESTCDLIVIWDVISGNSWIGNDHFI